MTGTTKRLLGVVLALAMAFSMISATSIAAFAKGTSVIINPTSGGTVTADNTSAGTGSTVTLTVTPDTGYVLDTLTVVGYVNGDYEQPRTVDTTKVDDTHYTFYCEDDLIPWYVSATFKWSGGSSSGTGTTEVETSGVEVVYEKDCSWTATYPASVTLADGTGDDAGTASATINFNVKGLIDVDHQVTITPTSTSVTLTGERHSGTITATITAPSSAAAATDVNSEDGADISATASATIESTLAVDKYSGTTTFKITCAEPAVETYTVTVKKDDDTTLATLNDVAKGTAWSVSTDGETLTIGDNTYIGSDFTSAFAYWRLNTTILSGSDSGTITEESTFTAVSEGF